MIEALPTGKCFFLEDEMTYTDAKKLLDGYKSLGSVYGLQSIQHLLAHLAHPEEQLKIIHVAGTNGKGSTVTSLAAVLEQCGYKTATYTSPEVTTYLDRFRIQEVPASEEDFLKAFEAVEGACQKMVTDGEPHPTIFEMEVAIAYLLALYHKVDVLIQETGLGGRLDATNAVTKPILTVFTAIGLDHMHLLGDTIEQITKEKAGIIKEGCPVVAYDNGTTINDILAASAHASHCAFALAQPREATVLERSLEGQRVSYQGDVYDYPLIGVHQTKNLALILRALHVLKDNGWHLSHEGIQKGLQKVHWPGRFEVLQREPCIILDGAHNPQAAEALSETVKSWFPAQKAHFIMHIFQDKDASGILSAIAPVCASLTLTSIHDERSTPLEALEALSQKILPDVPLTIEASLAEAIRTATQALAKEELLIICGSLSHLEKTRQLLAH